MHDHKNISLQIMSECDFELDRPHQLKDKYYQYKILN